MSIHHFLGPVGRRVALVTALLTVGTLLVLPACPATPEQHAAIDIDLQRFRVDVAADDYAIGGDQPLVTIVVWSDYACPPCNRTWQVMKNLVADYGDDIRVVFRAGTVPGFQHGEAAAEAALAAGGQGKFWEMHWRLFEHPDDFSRPVLRKHAEALGLDVQQFLDDIDTGRYAAQRIRDRRQASGLGLGPLPVAFVNGLFVLGFKEESDWHSLVDGELANARKLIQDGTPRANVYAEFMRTAVVGSVTEDSDEAKRLRAERKAKQDASKPELISKPDPKLRYAVPRGSLGFGPQDAPVVVVEFVDYQCPYCLKAHEQVVPALLAKYPDDVRVEIRQLPLEIHPAAAGAARAAITAGRQDGFAAFHAKLFELSVGGQGNLGFSTFVQQAGEIGLDVERFKTDFQTREVADELLADVLLARRLGVSGTPGFFVNGRYLQGARNPETFATLIDEDLVRAKQLTAAGTPRAELHEALMREAIGPAGFPNAGLELAPASTPSPTP